MSSIVPSAVPSSASGFTYAPSLLHRRLMDENEPALSYRGGEVKAWQRKLRAKLRRLTGYDRMPAGKDRPSLNVRSLWKREHELGTIEKLVFTAETGADVPAYLCLPRREADDGRDARPTASRGAKRARSHAAAEDTGGQAASGTHVRHPAFICIQGHTTGMHNSIGVAFEDETQSIEVAGDRDFALGCMKRGFAALCIEQRAFGERCETVQERVSSSGCHDAAMQALMLGRTLAAERVYDVDRGIDLLAGRDDIDLNRLGVMGNSGGGLISILSGALLPRIRFMMPSCGFCTYRDSIMSIFHCADNYIPGMLLHAEMADVLGLFAPKPAVVVAGKEDPIFPIAGVRKAFADVQAIYRAAGAEDCCKLVIGPEGHRFYADLAWPKMLKSY